MNISKSSFANSPVVVLGSLNADLVQTVQRLPKPGETIVGGDLQLYSGGKGANQACAAARMGGRVSMIGRVGRDSFAQSLLDSLSLAGVDATKVERSDRPTGTASISVLPSGENTIVLSPAANASLTPGCVAPLLADLRPDSLFLVQLEIPIETVFEALRLAKGAGARTVLDPAPARRLREELLRHVDFLTPNQGEALTLLEDSDGTIDNLAAAKVAAKRLRRLGAAGVILKLGSLGCFLSTKEMCCHVPGFAVRAVDTTAAGDTFNGAFAAALAEGKSPLDAAIFANAAAALSVTRAGAQTSIPSRQEVDKFLIQMAVPQTEAISVEK
ncbi:MAG: ribokinase [Acidobacteria bacterium]|nr:ribokinase [Acidobacteriota bacterium]MCI0626575.1 ribokinase [Acidobacteriota bacterium]MCI0717692.1 ribokinase [Acidobacteriota bacterium]